MIWLLLLCSSGLPAGLALLWRTPFCSLADASHPPASILIPARNEERNLPHLLGSIPTPPPGSEIFVIDDASTDNTAALAQAQGARVLSAPPLEPGWTGKTWACQRGAQAASCDFLLFLDADTWFEPQGLKRLLAHADTRAAVSVLPYHVMDRRYEQLSLFFNLLMALGAGGFGLLSRPRLFGQSLLIPGQLYNAAGGHAAVRRHILENLALSERVYAAGATCRCFYGRGTLNMRMFPDGLAQLCEGWTKAFADGAAASGPAVLLLSILWLSALCSAFLMLFLSPASWRLVFAAVYLLLALQIYGFAARLGQYRFLTCLLYPLPLCFYFALFGQSLYRHAFHRKVQWRGRQL